jgi:hypothetical protein
MFWDNVRQLYTEYRELTAKLKQTASEIPWWQNVIIMQKIQLFYQRKLSA